MNRYTIWIILLSAVILTGTGCAHKKKIKHTTQPVQQEQERQRVLDSIALAQAEAEAMRIREMELQRIQDSIAQAEAARKAMVQTLNIPRMTVTVMMQGKQLTTPATLRWQRGTGLVISIQPFAGLEMLRMELDGNALMIIDKINRRFTRITYNELAQMGAQTTLDDIDAWIDNNILARRDEPQLTLQVTRAGITGSAVIYTGSMQTDGNVNLRPANVDTYRQVTLEQLVKGL